MRKWIIGIFPHAHRPLFQVPPASQACASLGVLYIHAIVATATVSTTINIASCLGLSSEQCWVGRCGVKNITSISQEPLFLILWPEGKISLNFCCLCPLLSSVAQAIRLHSVNQKTQWYQLFFKLWLFLLSAYNWLFTFQSPLRVAFCILSELFGCNRERERLSSRLTPSWQVLHIFSNIINEILLKTWEKILEVELKMTINSKV